MQKLFKHSVSVILAVLIAFGTVSVAAFAADSNGECGENLSWTFDEANGTLNITGSGEMSDFLATQSPWYGVRSEIESVHIADGVTSIGNNAFYGCSSLSEAEIPASVTDIGINAFRDCSQFKEITLDEGVVEIGAGAFYASALETVTLPASVVTVGNNAFGWCASLESIFVSEDNKNYSNDEYGVLFNESKTELVKFPNNSEQTGYVIPATVEKLIADSFENCYSLKTVSIPASVTEIESDVFFNCYIESFVVDSANPNYSSDEIGVLCDKNKTEIICYPSNNPAQEYSLPESVKNIAADAFHGAANLKGVVLPDGITAVGDYAFLFCDNLEYIHIPASVTEIGEEIADYTSAYICSDSENAYAKEYAQANGYTFKLCTAHETGRKILASGVCGKTARWVLYEDGEMIISGVGAMDDFACGQAPWAAYADSVKNLSVEDEITYISEYAFYGCKNLESVDIPESVTGFGASAFEGCEAVDTVDFAGDLADWCAVDFGNEFANPAYGADELYISDKLVNDVEIPENVTEIGAYAFAGYEKVKQISFGGAESIGEGAFFGCTGLETVIIPENITEIGASSFGGCHALGFIHIPANVTEIGNNVIDKTAYICSDSDSAYAKEYAEANGFEFRLCKKHSVLGITLTKTELEMTKGSTFKLEAVINPEAALNNGVIWESDNPSAVFVDENGNLSAVAVGEATVTATTEEGGFAASCKVKVVLGEFSITWIVDGNETVVTANEGETVTKPSDPTKTGYTFIGWTPEIPDVMPARNLTFTARWEVNSYVAVFDANGGVWNDGLNEKSFTVVFGKRITAPEVPSKQGYNFGGWTPEIGLMDSENGKLFTAIWIASTDTAYTVNTYVMNADGTYKVSKNELKGTTDSTVGAEYTVETGFVLNEEKSVLSGVVAPDGSLVLEVYIDRVKNTVSINGESKEYLFGEEIAEPDAPVVPEGHYHDGWVDENGDAVEFPLVVGTKLPAEIKPLFVKCSYTVTWIVDGVETTETYEFEQEIAKPSEPVKKGYRFIEWTPEIPEKMPSNNLTFNAVFEKIKYTCPDCGEIFDDETLFNEHVAYEQAKKAMKVSIKNNPGTAKIKYGETLKLTAIVTGKVDGTEICWYVDGVKKGEGESFSITFESGTKTVEVKIVDSDGNVVTDNDGKEVADSQKVTVNASFWQKIVSFFKNLFRINRIITQSVIDSI